MTYLNEQKVVGLAMEGIDLCRTGELCLVQVGVAVPIQLTL